MMNLVRLIGGVVFMGLAVLTLVAAPARPLWLASLAATEWGYWIAIAALLPLIPVRGAGRRLGKAGAALSLGAMALLLMPVVRANEMNRQLPAAFDAAFGAARRERAPESEDPRSVPLVPADLFKAVQSRPIRFEERVFGNYEREKLTLDVYHPGYAHGPLPTVIVIHGGMWQNGDNAEFVPLNAYLAARDYVVVALNYRLAPRWKFPAARDDVLSAIAYLKVYGHEFGADPSRIALLGRSSGGQLALLAAYTANDPGIRGVISAYGASDLRYEYEHPAPQGVLDTRAVLENYLGGAPAKADDAYFAASPINFVSGASPPTLLIHGALDSTIRPEETTRLDARLREAGVKHMYLNLPWATHRCDRSFGGPCGQVMTYAIERFLDGIMTASPPPAQEGSRKKEEGKRKKAAAH
jgi:acetyl esterase/lipase